MKQIGNYTVEDQPIGRGGMGQVLKGYMADGTPVAIKEILPEFVMDMEFRVRIDREIDFLSKLNSPNVVKIYDNFQLNNNLYIVMELVDGKNIEQFIESGGALPADHATRYMIKILQTMQYVHEQGIVHRDIKPSNIMIRSNDEICMLDFGIAKDVSGVSGQFTQFGTIIGTDGYMSPEQADGMTIDHRSDIYSLACVFYYMLTAHHAYPKLASDVETQLNIVNTPFPKISKYVKGVSSKIQEVMDHATDRNMLKRYQSCREFCNELIKVSGGTQISTGNKDNDVSISVGREDCDICFEGNFKVSRHHADIRFKVFTGGSYFIYTDCSSNGTLIDGQAYSKGMSCNILSDRTPTIYLAKDPSCQLDWSEVKRLIIAKLNEREQEAEAEDVSGRTITMSEDKVQQIVNSSSDTMGFVDAIKTCFSKYAIFSGRASRAEFWWWSLFAWSITLITHTIFFIFALIAESPSVYILSFIVLLALLLPGLAVTIRRMHDVGKNALTFIGLLAGIIVPIIIMVNNDGVVRGLVVISMTSVYYLIRLLAAKGISNN